MGWIKSEILSGARGVVHGFSDGNLVGDLAEIAGSVGLRRIATVKQVHGNSVYSADSEANLKPEADAVISTKKGVGAGIFTADCAPVLIAGGGVAAAVHAGWRGVYSGIIEATLTKIQGYYQIRASEISAAVGPCIGGCCYEVGEDVASLFGEKFEDAGSYISTRHGGKYTLDLREAVRRQLQKAGVRDAEIIQICTKCRADFHSYRRDGKGSGRQMSFIGII